MHPPASILREHARIIWQSAVDAVRPAALLARALADPILPLRQDIQSAKRVIVLGGGKAGAAMSSALEAALSGFAGRVEGVVNVPTESVRPLKWIGLHAARLAGSNQPTQEGVAGTGMILDLARSAGPDDIGICLLSGGGSALLPAPIEGITLEDKQRVTLLLHACGATINEMNAVRKHLSRIKGGGLARAFKGRTLYSLIISDVIGDPLDVIASGPTAADPSTFADAVAILDRYELMKQAPTSVLEHFRRGAAGMIPETLKVLPPNVHNIVIGNNAMSLQAAAGKAQQLGYAVCNLGSYVEGETRQVANVFAGLVRAVRQQGQPLKPPACLLSGGETTVTLPPNHGKGGRNQEFVLACASKLGSEGLRNTIILSGGSDGEDGPTDAAGAFADSDTLIRAAAGGLDPAAYLGRNDAYAFFHATGDLLITGLTETNVMDVRVLLIA